MIENFEEWLNEDIWNNYPCNDKKEDGGSKLFTKSIEKEHKYGFWGLRIRSHEMLRKIEKLEVGDSVNYPYWTEEGKPFFKYKITRVE